MSTLKTNNIQHVDLADPSIIINNDGSVNIAGTMSYEDLTNVDSVGIITGRKQLHVGTGVSIAAGGLNVTAGITTVQALQATTGTFSSTVSGTTGTFTGGLDITSNVDISDSIRHKDDTDTKIRFPSADVFSVETGGSERVRVDGSGRLLYGHTSNVTGALFQINSNANFFAASNDANGAVVDLIKTRSTTPSGNTILQDGDKIGELRFRGNTGAGSVNGAVIQAIVNGTPGSGNDLPTDLVFRIMPDGSGSTLERLRITSGGLLQLNNDSAKIQLGASQDLSIYHDGSSNRIIAANADLILQSNNYTIRSENGSSTYLNIDSSGRLLTGGATTSQGSTNADDLQIGANNQSNQTGITLGSASASSIRFADAANDTAGAVYYIHGDDTLRLHVAGGEKLRITSAGQMGLGTNNPVQQAGLGLHINGTDQARLKLTNTSSGATANDGFDIIIENGLNTHMLNHENGDLKLGTNDVEKVRITSSGYMAVGNTSPQQLLHVWPDTTNASTAAVRVTAGDRAGTTGIQMIHDSNGNGQIQVVMYISESPPAPF